MEERREKITDGKAGLNKRSIKMRKTLGTILALVAALSLVAITALPVMAEDFEEVSLSGSLDVGEVVNVTLIGTSVNFGTITPGTADVSAVGQSDGTPAVGVKVESDTNVNVDISIKGDIGLSTLALENWKYCDTFGGTKTPMPVDYGAAVYDGVSANVTPYAFYHWVTVPALTTAGSYSCAFYYKAVVDVA